MKKFFMVQVREARMCSKINIEFSIDQILVVCLEAHWLAWNWKSE